MFKKYQGLKEELQQMCKVKANVVPILEGTVRAVTPRDGLQQNPITSEISVKESALTGAANIMCI